MKRISIFSGHYGSGKTNIAVNFAKELVKKHDKVSIYDLDIVNPYFRTVDACDDLEKNNVELVVSPYAETNVDIPAMNAKSYQMTADRSRYAVVDLGGDDRGALALGRFRDEILAENNFDMFLVVNKYRIETRTINDLISIKNEIEISGKIPFTAIINNSNLGEETTADTVLSSIDFLNELSKKLKLPIAYTTVKSSLYNELKDKINNLLKIDLIKYGNW